MEGIGKKIEELPFSELTTNFTYFINLIWTLISPLRCLSPSPRFLLYTKIPHLQHRLMQEVTDLGFTKLDKKPWTLTSHTQTKINNGKLEHLRHKQIKNHELTVLRSLPFKIHSVQDSD